MNIVGLLSVNWLTEWPVLKT